MMRSLFAAVTLALSVGFAGAQAQTASVAEQTVDTLNKIWGSHPGFRANHAKGVVVEGSFTPSIEGAKLSKAILFQGKASAVTVRFSDSGGLPTLPDGAGPANPHGLSVKFHLADGSDMDIVTNALKFFPVANGEEFLALLQALAASPAGAPKPTKLETFLAAHPAAPKAMASVSTPTSFARETYNGVDAFVFVDAAGKRQPFRFKIVPVAGEEHLSAADAAKQAPNFLMDEIVARIAKRPVSFKLLAQLANPGDQTKDPTQPWPDDRKLVDLGTITIDKAVADSKTAEKALLFLPSNLTDGIEMSDDPLIDARNQAYGVSFGRRSQ
ncbi:MAG: catalase family peroxidase [Beijerinckiaceae bacterium]|nr:catalase family peroxidase [Beijerinckiaceae bacterium]